MDLASGSRLKDRYEIIESIGEGGMGAVYLAHDESLDTQVAIKTNLNPGMHSERQFLREAQLLASLRHPNLPRVTDYFIEEDVQLLVMDFVPGDNLSQRLKLDGAQKVEDVLDWAQQLGSALSYLHSHDPPIIHRDIKPGNVKLMPDGTAVLVDFGIAKATGGQQTTTGARGYTPGFAPPEQHGQGKTGPYSDQYAFASTLYALMTGEAPPDSVERMLEQAELQPTRKINRKIPKHVDNAIQRALSIYPEERYASVDEFVAALHDKRFKAEPPTQPIPMNNNGGGGFLRFIFGLLLTVVVLGGLGVGGFFLWSSGTLDQLGILPVAQPSPTMGTPSAFLTEEALIASFTDTPTITLTPTVTETPAPSATLTPVPTPIGSGGGLIAFVSDRNGGIFQVYTMRPDGSDVTQLTFDETEKSSPQWSPDGTQLLYVGEGGSDFGLDIWVISADGSNPSNITQNRGDDTDPAWSPDGERIAFASTRLGPRRLIYVMDADGSDPERITRTNTEEWGPSFSPNGDFMVFSSSARSRPPNLATRTGEGINPGPVDPGLRDREALDPDWAPEGNTVAFTHIEGERSSIYLIEVDSGGDVTLILTGGPRDEYPSWAADGLWLAYTSSFGDNAEIWVVDSTGGQATNLTNDPATDKQPDWQP